MPLNGSSSLPTIISLSPVLLIIIFSSWNPEPCGTEIPEDSAIDVAPMDMQTPPVKSFSSITGKTTPVESVIQFFKSCAAWITLALHPFGITTGTRALLLLTIIRSPLVHYLLLD